MKFVPERLTQSIGHHKLNLEVNSPSLLFGAGIACVLGGTVLACRATLKLEKKVDSLTSDVDTVRAGINHGDKGRPYSRKEDGKRLAMVYVSHTTDILRLYGPSIVLTSTGVLMLTKSHSTLMQRNASLTAAYTVLAETFDAYRDRVRGDVGEKREMELYRGMERIVSLDADGKEEETYVVKEGETSPNARFFDESCAAFQKRADLNIMFVRTQQTFANQKLRANGHLFLNEVYDMLGMDRSSQGAILGWYNDPSKPQDSYVDFNIDSAKNYLFLDGAEPRLLLDFNVDGIVYNKIGGYVPKFITHKR